MLRLLPPGDGKSHARDTQAPRRHPHEQGVTVAPRVTAACCCLHKCQRSLVNMGIQKGWGAAVQGDPAVLTLLPRATRTAFCWISSSLCFTPPSQTLTSGAQEFFKDKIWQQLFFHAENHKLLFSPGVQLKAPWFLSGTCRVCQRQELSVGCPCVDRVLPAWPELAVKCQVMLEKSCRYV